MEVCNALRIILEWHEHLVHTNRIQLIAFALLMTAAADRASPIEDKEHTAVLHSRLWLE